MVFGLFKKKGDDDFSDFGAPSTSSADDMTKETHMGLPLDGDITKTTPSVDAGMDPMQSTPLDSPGSFKQLDEFTSQRDKVQQPSIQPIHSQASTHSDQETKHKLISLQKDMQVVNAKMDAIKSVLESINHRIGHIEKLAENGKPHEEVIRW